MSSNAAAPRELVGQRAVVTGSSKGIGRAIALELAAAGADLVVHCRKSRGEAEQTAQLADERGVRAAVLCADLSVATECAKFLDAAWKLLGGCDIWVNNAGADILTGEVANWPFERKLELLWAVDVRAAVLLSREAASRMQSAGGGVVLNLGWDQADTGMEGDSGQLFGTSKAAIMAFTKSLALAVAPKVRVNCVAPGWIQTAWGERASEKWQQRVVRETPLGRWGTPEDIARVTRFLCSPAASFITGQIWRVNGGAIRA